MSTLWVIGDSTAVAYTHLEYTEDPGWRAIYEKRCKEEGFSAYFDYSWQWNYKKQFEEAGDLYKRQLGIVVLHYFLLLHLLMRYGTRVAGFRTVLIHLQYGVCSHRYFHYSRLTEYLLHFQSFTSTQELSQEWNLHIIH